MPLSPCFLKHILQYLQFLLMLTRTSEHFVVLTLFPHLNWTMARFFFGVANAIRIASQTKETPFAITRQQSTSPHIIRSFVGHPVQTNPIVQHIDSQIKLEVMPTSIFVAIFLPFWTTNFVSTAIYLVICYLLHHIAPNAITNDHAR